jgi:hypothetical protein
VEGFVVLASCHPKSTILQNLGSPLGNSFLDMLAQGSQKDAAADFHTLMAAQAIQSKPRGFLAGKGNGNHKDNIREQFQAGMSFELFI